MLKASLITNVSFLDECPCLSDVALYQHVLDHTDTAQAAQASLDSAICDSFWNHI